MDNLIAHFIKHKLTFECLESTVELMNGMPGATVKLPASKYKLLKYFKSRSSLIHRYHIFCEPCKIFSECLPENVKKWTCSQCAVKLSTRETNYFVYIQLEGQIKQILLKHWDKIQHYNTDIINDDCQNIKDRYSGSLIREKLQKNTNILSLMINTDGISLKKSNKKSAWPVQIICNFLPPQLRYRKENIITVAFSYNDEKPDMIKLFEPFADEIENLETHGFIFEHQIFRVAVTSALLDLPAKAAFQQTMQYNGYFGCGFCLHKGENLSGRVKYPTSAENVAIREHSNFVDVMKKIYESKHVNINENGIKGISPDRPFPSNFSTWWSLLAWTICIVCVLVFRKI